MGWEEGLEAWPRPHVHAGTDVEVRVHKERETAQETAPGTGERENGNMGMNTRWSGLEL